MTQLTSFSDPKTALDYAERSVRLVPGLRDLQRMAMLLLAEQTPEDGEVLVVGAGGGMELKAFAETHPKWRLHGVDPSAAMLDQAKLTLGALASRVELQLGYVDAAPPGPFDAASCLLTLHFLGVEERRKTLQEIHRRLKRGGPLVTAHLSFGQTDAERSRWLSRYTAFAISSGVDPEQVRNAAAVITERLPVLSPAQDEEFLRNAGFTGVEVFYVGMAFRGWVAHA